MKRWTLPLFLLLFALPFAALAKGPLAPKLINPDAVPDSFAFLPPPPAEGSIGFKLDQDIYLQTRELVGTAAWDDAVLVGNRSANWREYFLDAFGMKITEETTPHTYALISRTFDDLNAAAESAKDHYQRVRPYDYYKKPGSTCSPKEEERFSKNGSYPSGHASYGWGLALILAEISPERQSAILKRGYAIGFSRIVCGVHWASDIDAGRSVAAAAVAQMHNNNTFLDLLSKSKAEIKALREKK
jgi:acid phosphatase (class A)